jgi:acyl-CoA thioesterase FadM
VHVFVEVEGGRPTPIPESIRRSLERLQGGSPS